LVQMGKTGVRRGNNLSFAIIEDTVELGTNPSL
jgi:hypothetical protein